MAWPPVTISNQVDSSKDRALCVPCGLESGCKYFRADYACRRNGRQWKPQGSTGHLERSSPKFADEVKESQRECR